MPDDPFRVLGVPHDASADEITDAWRARMRDLHPDANPGAAGEHLARLTEQAARVNSAYGALKADLEGERRRHGRVAAPNMSPRVDTWPTEGAPHQFLAPARIPGGWLFRRPVTWVFLFVALLAGLVILSEAGSSRPAQNPGTPTSFVPPVGWYAGNCLAGTQVVVPVRCTSAHGAKITAQVGAEEYCPAGTDGTVFRDNVYFCVDRDL